MKVMKPQKNPAPCSQPPNTPVAPIAPHHKSLNAPAENCSAGIVSPIQPIAPGADKITNITLLKQLSLKEVHYE